MEKLFYTVLKMSLAGSWVILAVLLLRFCLRKAPRKYSYVLWIAAAFRLLCPVSFQSPFSLFSLQVGSNTAPVVNLPAVTDAEYHFVRPQLSTGVPMVNMAVGNSLGFDQPDLAASANPEQIWLFIAMVLWCAGVAAMLLYSVISYLRLRLRTQDAVILERGVWQTERISSPFLMGIIRPRIYIPYHLEEQERCHILAHERMHLQRLDHIVKPLAFLILTLHWFNPLVWVAFVLMCRDMELSCDEAVLRCHGDIRREYSQTLLNVAASRRFPSPSPLAFGEGDVKCRIRSVLKWKKPGVWVTVIAILLCAAAILVCVSDPREEPENEHFPFADIYEAEEVVYQCPALSMLYRPEELPEFTLTSDHMLFLREPDGGEEQTQVGAFRAAEAEKELFDALFLPMYEEESAVYRRNNKNLWRLEGKEFWYLLEQKNGDLYLIRCLDLGNSTSARWMARLTPRNQIWASADGGGHYGLSRYRREATVDHALLPAVSTGQGVTLEFHLNWDADFLTVEEDYYDGSQELTRSSTTVARDPEGKFRMTVNRRGDGSGDYAVYSVRDGEFCHLLRVDFRTESISPPYDHETPDPAQTEQLRQAWNEARLRTVLAAHSEFEGAQLLDLVVATDSAEGLAGVAQYRRDGTDGCLAFVETSGIVHPVVLLNVQDAADSAMAYLPGDAVQLRLRSTENGNDLLYTVRFSRTPEGVHIQAESEPVVSYQEAESELFVSYQETVHWRSVPLLSGPGYGEQGSYVDDLKPGVYTIVEERVDQDGNLWGRLQSGEGWIDLTYSRHVPNVFGPLQAEILDGNGTADFRFVQDGGAWVSGFLITVKEPITNLRVVQGDFPDPWLDAVPGKTMYQLPALKPGQSFALQLNYAGISRHYLAFTDSRGQEQMCDIRHHWGEYAALLTEYTATATSLDLAVNAALRDELARENPTGLVQTRSYSVVSTEERGEDGIRVCAWVMCQDYSVSLGLQPVNTLFGPAVMEFEWSNRINRSWKLKDLQLLTDSQTPGDVKNFFGASAAAMEEGAFQKENYRQSLSQSCLQSAMSYTGMVAGT